MSARQHTRFKQDDTAARPAKVLVWDAPVRIFHWLMVFAFAGAWLSAEQDAWRQVHVTLGYTMVGLVGFRIVWGLVGTRYARFGDFVRGPSSVLRYLRSLLRGQPEHHTGHNPAGALAILALLALTLLVGLSGWATLYGQASDTMEELHEALATLMLALVGIHVAAVLLSAWLHHENLVGAMVSGYKRGRPADGVPGARRAVAAILLVSVLGFWWFQWQTPGVGMPTAEHAASGARSAADDDHGDNVGDSAGDNVGDNARDSAGGVAGGRDR